MRTFEELKADIDSGKLIDPSAVMVATISAVLQKLGDGPGAEALISENWTDRPTASAADCWLNLHMRTAARLGHSECRKQLKEIQTGLEKLL